MTVSPLHRTLLFFSYFCHTISQSTTYIAPYDCAVLNTTIFDPLNMKCSQCTNGGVPDWSATRCLCSPNQVKVAGSCQTCSEGSHSSPDSTACISCSGGECGCTDDSVLVYRNPNGTVQDTPSCVACANGTVPNRALGLCVPCFDPLCKCQEDPAYCPSSTARYNSVVNQIPSPLIAGRLPWAHVACRNGELQACQELINFCVLQNYVMVQDNACQLIFDLSMNEMRNRIPSYAPVVFNSIRTTSAPRQGE